MYLKCCMEFWYIQIREKKKKKEKKNKALANVQTKATTQTKDVEEDAILGHKTKIKFQTRKIKPSSLHIAHLSALENPMARIFTGRYRDTHRVKKPL